MSTPAAATTTTQQPQRALSGYGVVKSVESGDTLVITPPNSTTAQPPVQTRRITLSNITAPKYVRFKRSAIATPNDEPYGWEAKEYLRHLVVGKSISFNVTYATQGPNVREYATVLLQPSNEDLAHVLVKNGFATVKTTRADGQQLKQISPDLQQLIDLQEEAKTKQLGVHNSSQSQQHVREIKDLDVNELFIEYRNKSLPATIEQVVSGTQYRVEVVLSEPKQLPPVTALITLNLSGLTSPQPPLPLAVLQQRHERLVASGEADLNDSPTQQPEADPIALAASHFVEVRLLQRDVQVTIQGIDKFGNLFGSVNFKLGNISQRLLQEGLASYVNWSAQLTQDAKLFKDAELQAKQQRKRLWANWNGIDSSDESDGTQTDDKAKVVQVVSGDVVVVLNSSTNTEQRLNLASVRAPRVGNAQRNVPSDKSAEEAKEFIRAKLIGKVVKIVKEYDRSVGDESRPFVTLFVGKENINVALVAAGFAEVIRHRMDEPRSSQYDQLLAAEQKAQSENRGLHAKGKASNADKNKVIDLTQQRPAASSNKPEQEEKQQSGAAALKVNKSKQYLVSLQREKQISAIVEYVFNATRMKLRIPSQNLLLPFALAGIRSIPAKSADGKLNPVAAQATKFVRDSLMQHDVTVAIEGLDRIDTFVGQLMYGQQRNNLAVDLVRQGYATLIHAVVERSEQRNALKEAEQHARDGKLGYWETYVEPEQTAEAGGSDETADGSTPTEKKLVPIVATEIHDASNFYIQINPDNNQQYQQISTAMASFDADSAPPFEYGGKTTHNTVLAAEFSDGSWYRAKIEARVGDESFRVRYIDFGNSDDVAIHQLRPLPAELQRIPPQSKAATLAGIRSPNETSEYAADSAAAFTTATYDQQLKGRVELIDRYGLCYVTLYTADSNTDEQKEQQTNGTTDEEPALSINQQLLKEGWLKIPIRHDRRLTEYIQQHLKPYEQQAQRQHLNIWEYGIVASDDEA